MRSDCFCASSRSSSDCRFCSSVSSDTPASASFARPALDDERLIRRVATSSAASTSAHRSRNALFTFSSSSSSDWKNSASTSSRSAPSSSSFFRMTLRPL